jgi:undecaprenyl-diphosphatase
MDWRIYKAIYDVSLQHHWVGSLFNGIEKASIPFMVVVTVALWLLARPGGSRKWKVAATSGLAAAALALIANRVIASIWHRDRPFQDHTIRHPWSSSHDASFPSDHASASFAIAFAVLMIDTLAGALFLLAAAVIGIGRIFIGAHYPSDVGAGILVGLGAALIVVKLARPLISLLVRLVEKLTDPLLRPLWRRA